MKSDLITCKKCEVLYHPIDSSGTDTCHNCYVENLEAIMDKLPKIVADRLFHVSYGTRLCKTLIQNLGDGGYAGGWCHKAVINQVEKAIEKAMKGGK